ncbi:YunG family protein [Arthrobacter gengyunqii]|uniref:YunG family protein n=1 Tax=Arthrobacter gengyunqii TaxID=2886940 RepID=UPI003C2C325A
MTHTLRELELAFRQSWDLDTTCLTPDALVGWDSKNPAYGQCGPTALVVQDLLGGDLLIADVTGGNEKYEVHYWNRMPGGVEIDLTREQFLPHHEIGEPRVVARPEGGPRAYRQEYKTLRARVLSALAS